MKLTIEADETSLRLFTKYDAAFMGTGTAFTEVSKAVEIALQAVPITVKFGDRVTHRNLESDVVFLVSSDAKGAMLLVNMNTGYPLAYNPALEVIVGIDPLQAHRRWELTDWKFV